MSEARSDVIMSDAVSCAQFPGQTVYAPEGYEEYEDLFKLAYGEAIDGFNASLWEERGIDGLPGNGQQ